MILCVLPVVLSPVPVIAQLRTLEISFDVSGLASDGDGSNRTVRVGGDPLKFKMVIKNLTRTSLRVWKNGETGELLGVSFEITDGGGRKRMLKRRTRLERGKAKKADFLKPGERRIYTVSVADDTWNNIPAAGHAGYTIRAVFKNGARRVFSEPYPFEVGRR